MVSRSPAFFVTLASSHLISSPLFSFCLLPPLECCVPQGIKLREVSLFYSVCAVEWCFPLATKYPIVPHEHEHTLGIFASL
jgi:hypothetical protein